MVDVKVEDQLHTQRLRPRSFYVDTRSMITLISPYRWIWYTSANRKAVYHWGEIDVLAIVGISTLSSSLSLTKILGRPGTGSVSTSTGQWNVICPRRLAPSATRGGNQLIAVLTLLFLVINGAR